MPPISSKYTSYYASNVCLKEQTRYTVYSATEQETEKRAIVLYHILCIISPWAIPHHQYFNVDRVSVCVSVCLSVTDVTSLPQRVLWERGFTITRTLGTSLLTVGAADMVIFIAA